MKNDWWDKPPLEKYKKDDEAFETEQNFFDFGNCRPDYMIDETYGPFTDKDKEVKPIQHRLPGYLSKLPLPGSS